MIIFHRRNISDLTARSPGGEEEVLETQGSLGRTIQSLLLPKITQHDSHEFLSEIISSPSDSFGGDWYFVIESSCDRKIISGDVFESGVHGALGVAAIISLLHEARQRELDTQSIAKFINYRLIQLFERKLSTTLTIISLALDGTVEICNCGGSGVLLLSKHSARHFGLNSKPLGISYEPEIASSGLSLADNDIIRSYLEGYCQDPHALLVCVLDNDKIAAVATSLPLSSNSHIVAGGPSLFRTHGEDPLAFYYYAEIIVRPPYRRAGIAKEICRLRKNHANSLGLRSLCLAVVERAKNHPLCPANHIVSEPIWKRDGFSPTDMTFVYNWPTIQANGTVADQENVMRFWTKKHRTD